MSDEVRTTFTSPDIADDASPSDGDDWEHVNTFDHRRDRDGNLLELVHVWRRKDIDE